MNDDEEDLEQVSAEVPASTKEAVKEKLEFGGITREIRELMNRIAYGEDLTQRSRLERQKQNLREDRKEQEAIRREAQAEIENIDQRIDAIDEKLSNITSKEDKFEARLEGLEHRLRVEGQRLDKEHGAVKEVSRSIGVEPEGVIKELKSRNPDVPSYAFQDGLHDRESWDGLPDSLQDVPVAERESLGE